jgi:demethylmenaquinone methyltransferase/2-methoxy-6-polyprenyl-1,4-benzoquinol methylase
MLGVGRDRMVDRGHAGNLVYAQVDAEALPVPDDSLDLISIAFGLRNVTDKAKALGAMYRALKPGGRALILEFSKPRNKPLEKAYDLYSFKLLPKMGELVAKDAESYRYLAESIRMHPDQETLKGMMEDAGFERCDVHNLTGGIVAVHRGFKI